MPGYYDKTLAADRLRRCYEIAPPRIRQYLDAEIDTAAAYLSPTARVLELGCGYGRILKRLDGRCETLFGIDTSASSLALAHDYCGHLSNCYLAQMDASRTGLADDSFDVVLCLQNGLSAFAVDRFSLVAESLRLTAQGGAVVYATYAARFWPERLRWFELQAAAGLLGEIDYAQTGEGVIVCRDGFRAETVTPDEFMSLTARSRVTATLREVDESSLFCIIRP